MRSPRVTRRQRSSGYDTLAVYGGRRQPSIDGVTRRPALQGAASSGAGAMTVVFAGQGEQDANAATLERLPELRRHSRYAVAHNPIARAIRRCFADHVIGSGIVPRSAVNPRRLGISESQAREFEEAADEVFRDASRFADVTGRQEYVGLQRLVFLSIFDAGDVFPSFPMVVRDDGAPVTTRINLIEAERVETPIKDATNPRVRGGVQLDAWGAPEGYWVVRDHPGDQLAARRFQHEFWSRSRNGRVNVMQAYAQDRIGQARGLPVLHAALPIIDQVGQYVDSTIFQAELQTRLSLWITTQGDPEQMAQLLQARDSAAREAAYAGLLEAGVQADSINLLAEGDDVKSVSPSTPGAYWDALIVRLLRLCGAAAGGAPFELFSNDVGAANYSAIRAALMAFRKTIAQQHEALLPVFRVHRELALWEAWLDGKLLPGAPWLRMDRDRAGWLAAKWHLPAQGWIDPTKEVAAYTDAVDAGFMSRGDVIAQMTGETYLDVARRRADEARIDRELGLERANKVTVPVAAGTAPREVAADDESERDQLEPDDGEEVELNDTTTAGAR